MGTLWTSIKQIKAPYVFDWEPGIVLHAMQRNRASSLTEGEVSRIFWSSSGTCGIFSSYGGDGHSTRVCSATSGLLSSYDGYLKNLNQAWQDSTETSRSEA